MINYGPQLLFTAASIMLQVQTQYLENGGQWDMVTAAGVLTQLVCQQQEVNFDLDMQSEHKILDVHKAHKNHCFIMISAELIQEHLQVPKNNIHVTPNKQKCYHKFCIFLHVQRQSEVPDYDSSGYHKNGCFIYSVTDCIKQW